MLFSRKLSSGSQRGFTIVELLIVIVVIGILAAITIVAYNGVQESARDARRKSDLDQISQLIQLYDHDKGAMGVGSGCGSQGNGNGWFNYETTGGTSYPRSIMGCLQDDKTVPASMTIMDPSGKATCGGLTCHAYMKYTCSQSGSHVTYIFANLETVGHTSTDTDTTCNTSADTSYGMNYFVKVTDD